MNLELFNINFDNFLMIIIIIHIGILLLIGGSALIYGKKTLNYPITRFQLAIIIIFLWLSVFLLFKEKEKKSTEL
jgi:hypothetical protein